MDYVEYANKLNSQRLSQLKGLQNKGFTPTQAYLHLLINQEASWYAFQNLRLFEDLYETGDKLYIPDDELKEGNMKKDYIVEFYAMK